MDVAAGYSPCPTGWNGQHWIADFEISNSHSLDGATLSSSSLSGALSRIPAPVIALAAEALANANTHTGLNQLFYAAGAPGEPPVGNKVAKCQQWLVACNKASGVDPLAVLGGVLEHFMESEIDYLSDDMQQQRLAERGKIERAMQKYSLSYAIGGRVIPQGVTANTKSLYELVRARDIGAIQREVERGLETVSSDPPATLTAACAIVESACKVYIEDENLPMPAEQTIGKLWNVVKRHIRLDAASYEDEDMRKVLGGLASIVDGIGAFRTRAGSAHGRGRNAYRVAPRHAVLAMGAAHSLVLFLMETWEDRRAHRSGLQ